jgi:hypothetical protein
LKRILEQLRFVLIALLVFFVGRLVVLATPPTKISDLASIEDLVDEMNALRAEIHEILESEESYTTNRNALHRSALELALCAQALIAHDHDSTLKESSPDVRSAALALASSKSHKGATEALQTLQRVTDGTNSGTAVSVFEWKNPSSLVSVMSAMTSRSQLLRQAIRKRARSPESSRHAMVIAILTMVVHNDLRAIEDSDDTERWRKLSLELQRHMTNTAQAMKNGDASATDSFRFAMEVCHTCHENFKH